jgi:hypothetical protein
MVGKVQAHAVRGMWAVLHVLLLCSLWICGSSFFDRGLVLSLIDIECDF